MPSSVIFPLSKASVAFRPSLSDKVGGQNICEGTRAPNWSDGCIKGSGNNVVLRKEAKNGCRALRHSVSKVVNSSMVASSKQPGITALGTWRRFGISYWGHFSNYCPDKIFQHHTGFHFLAEGGVRSQLTNPTFTTISDHRSC